MCVCVCVFYQTLRVISERLGMQAKILENVMNKNTNRSITRKLE